MSPPPPDQRMLIAAVPSAPKLINQPSPTLQDLEPSRASRRLHRWMARIEQARRAAASSAAIRRPVELGEAPHSVSTTTAQPTDSRQHVGAALQLPSPLSPWPQPAPPDNPGAESALIWAAAHLVVDARWAPSSSRSWQMRGGPPARVVVGAGLEAKPSTAIRLPLPCRTVRMTTHRANPFGCCQFVELTRCWPVTGTSSSR